MEQAEGAGKAQDGVGEEFAWRLERDGDDCIWLHWTDESGAERSLKLGPFERVAGCLADQLAAWDFGE